VFRISDTGRVVTGTNPSLNRLFEIFASTQISTLRLICCPGFKVIFAGEFFSASVPGMKEGLLESHDQPD
jgi:hypothetical protein